MSQTIDRPGGSGSGVGLLDRPTRTQIRGDDPPPEQRIGGQPWIVAKHVLTVHGLRSSRPELQRMGLEILEDHSPPFFWVMRKQRWTRTPESILPSRQEYKDETGRVRFVQHVDLPNRVAHIELL